MLMSWLMGMNPAMGQPVITSFSQNGALVCNNLAPGSFATVTWAPSLSGPWQTNLAGLNGIVVGTDGSIQVTAPVTNAATAFFRVLDAPATGNGIYVSAFNGSDMNNGASPSTPIATLARAYVLANNQPTNIFLRRGSVFHEPFHVPDNSIVSAYGSGPKPIVDGTIILTNASFSLAPGWTNTYQYPLSQSLLWSTNGIQAFACSNVLMVWETDSQGTWRQGNRWSENAGFGSTTNVENNPGSFWYDTNKQTLYIHTIGNNSPVIDGNTYAASIQTLAVWGGTNFWVQDVEARYAYAYDGQGNEGYACDATGYGTFYHCRFHGGWNHVAGYANNYGGGWPAPLTWNACDIYDGEQNASASLCIVFNGGITSPMPVFIWTNCLVWQPNTEGAYTTIGFYSHGNGEDERIVGCVVTNMPGYGGLGFCVSFHDNFWGYDTNAADNPYFDFPAVPCVMSNCVTYGYSGQGLYETYTFGPSALVSNIFVNVGFSLVNSTIAFTNNIDIATRYPATSRSMFDQSRLSTGHWSSISNDFAGWGNYFNASTNGVVASDHNDFYDCTDLGWDGTKEATLSQWQAEFPMEQHSTTNTVVNAPPPPPISDPAGD
jgi:hypothetical protein